MTQDEFRDAGLRWLVGLGAVGSMFLFPTMYTLPQLFCELYVLVAGLGFMARGGDWLLRHYVKSAKARSRASQQAFGRRMQWLLLAWAGANAVLALVAWRTGRPVGSTLAGANGWPFDVDASLRGLDWSLAVIVLVGAYAVHASKRTAVVSLAGIALWILLYPLLWLNE